MIQPVFEHDYNERNILARDVVDRVEISQQLLNEIHESSNSIVIILYAESGLGKTALKRKLLAELSSKDPGFLVINSVPSVENDNLLSSPKGLYLHTVFDEMKDALVNARELSFQDFYLSSSERKRRSARRLLDFFGNKSRGQKTRRFAVAEMLKRLFNLGEYDANDFQLESSEIGITLQASYIEKIMGERKTIVAIENAQNIDEYSFEKIGDILNSTRHLRHVVLLEYTIGDNHGIEEAIRMKERWRSTQVETRLYALEKLGENHICDAVHRFSDGALCSEHESEKLIEYYLESSGGNLYSVFVYFEELKNRNEGSPNSPTAVYESAVLQLDDAQLEMLVVVAADRGRCSLSALECVLEKSEIDITATVSHLVNRKLVIVEGDTVKLSHASIGDAITQTDNARIRSALYRGRHHLVSYYESVDLDYGKTGDGRDVAWMHLVSLYAASDPKKLGTLLEKIQQEAVQRISPKQAWSYMSQFVECTKEEIGEQVNNYWTVLDICFACELYQEGFEVLTIMEDNPKLFSASKVLAYKASFLSALDRHEENIKLFEALPQEAITERREWIEVALAVLASYRSLGEYKKCEELAERLKRSPSVRGTHEEAILLRLSELFMGRKEAVRFVRKSADTFEKLGLFRQAGKSLVNLAYLHAQTGNPDEALRCLDSAKKYLKNEYIGKHMTLVNESLAFLRMGCYERKVWELLDEAEESAVVAFDKLAIIMNKIAWCCANEEFGKVDYLASRAEELALLEPDKDCVCLVHNNFQVAYTLMGNEREAHEHSLKMEKLSERCKSIQALRSGDKLACDYLFKHGWYAGGLAYWTFDLPEL